MKFETQEDLLKKVSKLINKIFKNPKKGYIWLECHFLGTKWSNVSKGKIHRMIMCLEAKLGGKECFVHSRVHATPTKIWS